LVIHAKAVINDENNISLKFVTFNIKSILKINHETHLLSQ